MGRNLKNKKKLTPIRITNNAHINIKIIVNNIGTFSDSTTLNSGLVNNTQINNISCE